MPPSRLHQLPDSAAQHVVRHMISTSSGIDSTRTVEFEDALTVVHPSCPLRDVARPLFSTLQGYPPSSNSEEVFVRLPDDIDCRRLTRWFDLAGQSLAELVLPAGFEGADPEDIILMLEAFEKNCLALRSLDIADTACND